MTDKKYLILMSTFFLLITLLLGYIISHISIVIGILIIMIIPLAFFIMEIFVTSQESVFDKTFRKVGVMFLCVLVSSNIYFMIKDIGDFKWNSICDIIIYTSLITLIIINLIVLIILKIKYNAKIDDTREVDFNYFYNKYYKIDEKTERRIKRKLKK